MWIPVFASFKVPRKDAWLSATSPASYPECLQLPPPPLCCLPRIIPYCVSTVLKLQLIINYLFKWSQNSFYFSWTKPPLLTGFCTWFPAIALSADVSTIIKGLTVSTRPMSHGFGASAGYKIRGDKLALWLIGFVPYLPQESRIVEVVRFSKSGLLKETRVVSCDMSVYVWIWRVLKLCRRFF